VSYFSFNCFCWCGVLHFVMYNQDSLFADVVFFIQVFLLILRFTHRSVYIYTCSSMCILFSFVLCLTILSSFLSVLLKSLHYYSGRQSICWCRVLHSTFFAGLAFYTSFCVWARQSICWCYVLHSTLFAGLAFYSSWCITKTVYLLVSYFSFNSFCWSCFLHLVMCNQDNVLLVLSNTDHLHSRYFLDVVV
jgi:hypothetical protein